MLAKAPVMSGTMAAPTMAVVIKPEISLVSSGILSTAMEKISGKILAKPIPISMKLSHVVTALYGINNSTLPTIDTRMVIIRNTLGLM